VLRLRDGRLTADWTAETSEELFVRVRKTMQRIADVLGADYADNPMWFRKRIITVHPLGGAPMGAHPGDGVCDAFGEVFGFPGLYIADGAAMPGPVGPNPSLTIAAHADRMATRLLESAPARRGAGRSAGSVPSSTGAEPAGGAGSPDGSGDGSGFGGPRRVMGTVLRGGGPYGALVHGGHGGLRRLRRDRPAGGGARRGPAPAVLPPDDHRGRRRPLPGRTRPRGARRGVGRRGRARRPASRRARHVQPVRRSRRGGRGRRPGPAADEVPAVLHRRRRAAAHAQRGEEGAARPADEDLAGHLHALRAAVRRPRRRGRG